MSQSSFMSYALNIQEKQQDEDQHEKLFLIVVVGCGKEPPKPSGATLGTGTWAATQLIAFVSYGTLPPPNDNLEGGKANVRVTLLPSSGGSLKAVLQIHCLLGSFPAGVDEGIRLNVPGVNNFNKEIHGQTLFIK